MREKHFVGAEIEPDVEKIDLAGKGGKEEAPEKKLIKRCA